MHTHQRRRRDTWTWCNRNGTYLRVLLVTDPNDPPFPATPDIDITIQRLVVLSATGIQQLDQHTTTLQRAATRHGLRLVPADGYHRLLVDRITAANHPKPNTPR